MSERRKKGIGSISQRNDGRWEGRYIVGYKEDGKPIKKSVFGKTRTECNEKLMALRKETTIIAGRLPTTATPSMKFGEWMDMWFNCYCSPAIRETTKDGYRTLIYNHIIPEIGDVPLNQLTQADLQTFYTRMKKCGRIRNVDALGVGLSDRTIRGCHQRCRAALDKAVEERLISKNPAIGCKLPPKKAAEMKILTHNEMYRLLQQAKYEGYYELILLELSTGMRRGEILGLQWKDLDEKTGELRIERQISRINGKLTAVPPKTKQSIRSIILPMPLVELLMRYKESVESKWLFPSPVKEGDEPRDPQSLYHRTQLLLERAGCKRVRFHDLRHTFATMSLESGMDVKTLSAMIGHISSATTLDIYSHITNEMQVNAARKIDNSYGRDYEVYEEETKVIEEPKPVIKPFDPYKGKIRKSGTGGIYELNDHLYEGRYTPTNANGKRESHNVYGKTREECQEKLDAMIVEVRARINAEKEAMRRATEIAN